MAPKIATYSVKHNDVPVAFGLNKLLIADGETYVSEPSHESPSHQRWQSELLIPYQVKTTKFAFLGPFRPTNLHLEMIKEFFPIYHRSIPRVCVREKFDLGFLKSDARPFRSSPPKELKNYVARLDRVQSVKGASWRNQGFFDLIQLSRKEISYNPNMLLEAIHFWESSTNTFQLPCGMITPTLFDVAAITGVGNFQLQRDWSRKFHSRKHRH